MEEREERGRGDEISTFYMLKNNNNKERVFWKKYM